jgi:hypothetical protein
MTLFSGTGESFEEDLKTFFTDENQLLPFLPICLFTASTVINRHHIKCIKKFKQHVR